MGDSFYRSKDPTNSIEILKEMLRRKTQKRKEQNTLGTQIVLVDRIIADFVHI